MKKINPILKVKNINLYILFIACYLTLNPGYSQQPLLAKWDFACENVSFNNGEITVNDVSNNKFIGTLMNGAKIRSFGYVDKFYVLDLGSNNGYFDMGTEIGKFIYQLGNNYTISAYYYIDPLYESINQWGNCLWSFSNDENLFSPGTGGMYCSLKNQGAVLTKTGIINEYGINIGENAPLGIWKHIAYSQDGDTGRLFIDGVQKKAQKVTLIPSEALPLPGRTGTLYNTLGAPAYQGDFYLKNTLVYDFELYNISLSEKDLLDDNGLNVDSTVASLNGTFFSSSDVPPLQELRDEFQKFSLDIDTVSGNINLPFKGILDTTIIIQWKTNRPDLISSSGNVNRPDYLNMSVVLTACFIKDCHMLEKSFNLIVLAKQDNSFKSDLLLHYIFSPGYANGDTVTDAAENHFTGTLMNGAQVYPLVSCFGESGSMLWLPNDSAYFDMGTECGKLIYGLNDYSVGAFFYIDPIKANFNNLGNILYSFSNSANPSADRNGYMLGVANHLFQVVSPKYLASGIQSTPTLSIPELGIFHHFMYTQKENIGTVYVDGDSASSNIEFTNLPSKTLVIPGRTGTLYNYIGKSCFPKDVGLGSALISDFRLYNKSLTKQEVSTLYDENYLQLEQTLTTCGGKKMNRASDNYHINTSTPGLIQILNLTGKENVRVFDILGRRISVNNIHAIAVKPGIYIVHINQNVIKVLVK